MSAPDTRRITRGHLAAAQAADAPAGARRAGGADVMVDRVVRLGPDGQPVLADVSFEVAPGAHVALVGSTGSGKTTLLRMIAGMLLPDHGDILVDGVSLASFDYVDLRQHRLRTGFAFEDAGLLSNVSIFENVALPLRYHYGRALDEAEIRARVRALLGELEIEAHAATFPPRVNPCVRKRAHLARALILEPALLLIDEPQAGLVAAEQEIVRRVCEGRRAERGMTIIQTDHDGAFGPFRPERVILLEAGRVKAIGAPGELAS